LILVMLAVMPSLHAQKQLVLLKKEKMLLRLYPGDEIVFRLKKSKRIVHTYINNLSDTAMVTHRDTVPFHTIERVYFRQSKFYNVIGSFLVIGGAGYFLVDQINVTAVQGHKASLDRSVTTTSVIALAVGLPMMLLHKKSQKLSHRSKLLMVKDGSHFYRKEPTGYVSPFIPEN